MSKYILSVDGGGIRGIIPAMILAEIEKRTNKPISQIFDLIAGTSTGGIVAAGLCKKDDKGKSLYSATDLVELYQEYGSYIFQSSFLRKAITWFNGAEYSYKNIEHVLGKYFGEDTLNNTLNNLLLPSYDIHNHCPFFFKNWKEDRNFIKISDALRAITAAPTYFIPKHLKVNHTDRILIDGGVFANNPANCAYASSKRLFPNDNIVILSIGTGILEKPIKYNRSRRYGKITWIKPLLDVMFNSGLDAVDYQLNEVMSDKYIRIQSELTIASTDMDNTTKKNIQNLKKEAEMTISNNKRIIEEFCKTVT